MNSTKRSIYNKRVVMILITLLVFLMMILIFNKSNIKSSAIDNNHIKYYKSIVIQPNSSLWSIADDYNNGSEYNTKEYISEIIKINNLTSKKIHAGNNLIIFYYGE